MMTSPHIPGTVSSLAFHRNTYNPYQWALWVALEDSYYADVGGYAACRMPTPGRKLDMERFRNWQATMVRQFAYESSQARGEGTKGLEIADWPENLWLYCYERMVDADHLKAAKGPETVICDG